jgi:phage baseplate assembly protein W
MQAWISPSEPLHAKSVWEICQNTKDAKCLFWALFAKAGVQAPGHSAISKGARSALVAPATPQRERCPSTKTARRGRVVSASFATVSSSLRDVGLANGGRPARRKFGSHMRRAHRHPTSHTRLMICNRALRAKPPRAPCPVVRKRTMIHDKAKEPSGRHPVLVPKLGLGAACQNSKSDY